MTDLPTGVFCMGGRDDDKFTSQVERPQHRVEIGLPIALGCCPVTASEYAEFSGTGNRHPSLLPIIGITWDEAVAYCDWLSEETGHGYRLPTEAEWEYACRGGVNQAFPTGDLISPRLANYLYDEDGTKVGPGRTTAVGSYPSNAFGLFDMVGNVCEWVMDAWHPHFHGAPVDGQSWPADAATKFRVLRGGAWDYLPRLLRCSWRDYLSREIQRDNVGFRVACAMHEHSGELAA